MTSDAKPRPCEVPGCPNLAGYGLRVCEQHLQEPAAPRDRAEALAYLRERLAHYDRFWPDPDRADSLDLHGSYDIAALRRVSSWGTEGESGAATAGWSSAADSATVQGVAKPPLGDANQV